VDFSFRKKVRLKARETRKWSRENRGTKRRRREAIPERRTNRCKGPDFNQLIALVTFSWYIYVFS